jgi:dipeptidyl aminopeptidase/acylaminoacyl peptidase
MQLVNLDLRTDEIRNLGVMLGYHDWLAVSGRRLLMVKGNDRSAFFGKRLWLCSLGGSCRAIPGLPKEGISLDPAWPPDGHSMAFVMARTWNPSGIISGARYRSWLDSHVLWIASGDGSGAHPLAGVPRGAADPEWTPDGRGLLFERDGSLWLIPHVGASNAHPLVVLTKHVFPDLHHPAYQRWYYGHMDWHDLFAWH